MRTLVFTGRRFWSKGELLACEVEYSSNGDICITQLVGRAPTSNGEELVYRMGRVWVTDDPFYWSDREWNNFLESCFSNY